MGKPGEGPAVGSGDEWVSSCKHDLEAEVEELLGNTDLDGKLLHEGWSPCDMALAIYQGDIARFDSMLQQMQRRVGAEVKAAVGRQMLEKRTWAQDSTKKGGKVAHKYIKSSDGPRERRDVVLSQGLGMILEVFNEFWSKQQKSINADLWKRAGEEQLPEITVQVLDEVFSSFKHEYGWGPGGSNPRSWAGLPVEFKQRLAKMLMRFEDQPETVRTLVSMVVFLAKPEGGVRPIVLLEAIFKVWGKVRRGLAKKWEHDHNIDAFWGQSGKAADQAGWLHQVLVSFARAKGLEAGTLATDLRKFYETIKHGKLMEEAEATGFPLKVARAATVIYGGWRSATWQDIVADPFCPDSTVMVGCCLATTFAKVMLVRTLCKPALNRPAMWPRNIVDDVIIQTVGSAEPVETNLGEAGDVLSGDYERLDLELEGKKTKFLASAPELAIRLEARWSQRGVKRTWCMRNVGTDAHLDARRRAPTAGKRLKEGTRRHRKVMRLRDLGAEVAGIQRASPTAQGLWGCAVHGLTRKQRRGLRTRSVHTARGKKKGAGLGLRAGQSALTDRFDPEAMYHEEVVLKWASAVWHGTPGLQILDAVLARARLDLRHAKDPWKAAAGPEHVLLLTMADLGWEMHGAATAITQDGLRFDLRKTSPKLISRLAGEAARTARDREDLRRRHHSSAAWLATEGPGSPGIFWQRLRAGEGQLSKELTQREASALSSVQSLCHWTQQRQYRHLKAEDEACLLCKEAPGTLFHRRFKCKATQEHRRQHMPKCLSSIAEELEQADEGTQELLAAGILPTPTGLAPRPVFSSEAGVNWVGRPSCGRMFGTLGTDGSGMHPKWRFLRRAGWAVVMLDEGRRVVSVAWGAVPFDQCPLQTSRDAEDYAVLMASRLCCLEDGDRCNEEGAADVKAIHIDCKGTLGCFTDKVQATSLQHARAPVDRDLVGAPSKRPGHQDAGPCHLDRGAAGQSEGVAEAGERHCRLLGEDGGQKPQSDEAGSG